MKCFKSTQPKEGNVPIDIVKIHPMKYVEDHDDWWTSSLGELLFVAWLWSTPAFQTTLYCFQNPKYTLSMVGNNTLQILFHKSINNSSSRWLIA